MPEENKPYHEESRSQQVRRKMVDTAVNFLLNPSVIDKPYEQKTAFLRKKGLTDQEISSAYEIAESDPKSKQIQQSNSIASSVSVLPPPVPVYGPISFWSQLSRFSSSLIVLGVAVFGAHYVYKKYIEPLIYGEDKKSKSEKLEKQLQDMANCLFQLEKNVSSLQENIIYQKEQMDKLLEDKVNEYYHTPLALRELKTEISSVKSLVLNRHQFPALPKVTPSIPQWQLPLNNVDDNISKENTEVTEHQHLQDSDESGLEKEFKLKSDSPNLSNGESDIISEVKPNQEEFSEELNNKSPVS